MAKGNMLQGMSRGKVGDVVFSRLDGEQIARVRNRHPKNPKSAKQLYQRAIMATVMQAYSAGIEIFDHSFEGCAKGAECQRRFISLNSKLLRDQIANDIKNSVELDYQVGRVVAPGIDSPVPCCLQVSEGSLSNNILLVGENGVYFRDGNRDVISESWGDYCQRVGITKDDIFTIVIFAVDRSKEPLFSVDGLTTDLGEDYPYFGKLYPGLFAYARLSIKESFWGSDTKLINMWVPDAFDIEATSHFYPEPLVDLAIYNSVNLQGLIYKEGSRFSGTIGIIRSKKNTGLRSNCKMSLEIEQDGNTYYYYGIASQFALAAWQQDATSLGDSDLILEGGDD